MEPEALMLSFQQKVEICSSFPELERKDVSLGRVNYAYEDSAYDKKTVVYHLHPNGNGYVYAGLLPGVPADPKGFANIRELSEEELRTLIRRSIASLTQPEASSPPAASAISVDEEQVWSGPDNQTLLLKYENELWYVFAGDSLESAFETLEEAEEYLREEGFKPPHA
jgi:hypothetical protein